MRESDRPDGITKRNIHDARGSFFVRWPFDLAALGLLLVLAFLGVFGSSGTFVAEGGDVGLVIEGPVRIRNGNFYETRLRIDIRRNVRDLVVLVDENVWHEMTVNSTRPEPSEYGFRDGAFELHFGEFEAGENLAIVFDAQVNSGRWPGTNAGTIALADGDEVLATADYALEVLP